MRVGRGGSVTRTEDGVRGLGVSLYACLRNDVRKQIDGDRRPMCVGRNRGL